MRSLFVLEPPGNSTSKPEISIDVFMEGQKTKLYVTGIYQDVSNMGQGFRLHENALKKLNPIYTPSVYSIKLKYGVNVSHYKKYLLRLLEKQYQLMPALKTGLHKWVSSSGMKAALSSLSIFFIVIMLQTIGTDMMISIKQNQINTLEF
jgi:hypothetical protein